MTNSEKKAPQPKTKLRVITPIGAKISTSHKFINGSGFTVKHISNRLFIKKTNFAFYADFTYEVFAQIDDNRAVILGIFTDRTQRASEFRFHAYYTDGIQCDTGGRETQKLAVKDILRCVGEFGTSVKGLSIEENGTVRYSL